MLAEYAAATPACRRGRHRHRHGPALGGARRCRRAWRCRATSTRWRWSPAARRWRRRRRSILGAMRGRPFIFNLGHGIEKETDPEHVAALVRLVRTGADPHHPRPDQGMAMPRVAVVLFNLGRPGRARGVRPFLVNLFTDPAILRVPVFVRPWLGRLIAWRRTKAATANYALLGGRSPLLELTEEQARALEAALPEPDAESRCFVAMRYWHPFSDAAAARRCRPGSRTRSCCCRSIRSIPPPPPAAAHRLAPGGGRRPGWRCRPRTLCCYHSDPASPRRPRRWCATPMPRRGPRCRRRSALRVLFSAHGLPETIVKAGRPLPVAGRADGGRGGRRSWPCPELDHRGLLPVPRHAAEMDRPQHRGGAGAGRRRTRWRCWSARSPSSPSIPRPWWSWTSNTASWRSSWACPAISACRRRTATPASSPRCATWRGGAWPADRRCAASPAAGNARSRSATARMPRPPRRQKEPGLMRPAAVLFDCDGVLADSEGLVNRIVARGPDRARLAADRRAGAGDLPRHGAAHDAAGDRGPLRAAAGGLGRGAGGPHRPGAGRGGGGGARRHRGAAGGGGGGDSAGGRLQFRACRIAGQAGPPGAGADLRRPGLQLRGRGPGRSRRPTCTWPRRRPAGPRRPIAWSSRTACSAPAAGIAAGCRVLGFARETDARVLAAVGAVPFASMAALPALLGLAG